MSIGHAMTKQTNTHNQIGSIWLALCVGIAIGMFIDRGSFTLPDGGGIFDNVIGGDHAGAWVMLVEESGERSPATSRVIATDLAQSLKNRGLVYRLYDIDDGALDPTVKAEAKRVGLPALVIVSKGGKLLWSGNQPPDKDSIDSVVKKATGK